MVKLQLSQYMHILLVFVLSLLFIAMQAYVSEKPTPYADNISYMAVSLPLLETGVYEDGNFKNSILPPAENGEGMFFPPLYPVFLTGLMAVNDSFVETAKCSIEYYKPEVIDEKCNVHYNVVVIAQSILGALSAVFLWLTAQLLFKRTMISWLSVGIIVTLGTFAYSAISIMPEALILVLFYGATYFFVRCFHHPKLINALICGVLTGALLLTKPAFLYVVYFTAFLFIGVGLYALVKHKNSQILKLVSVMVLATALVVGPWVYRNYTKIGYADITYGYGPFTLAQRVAYNEMTWKEWGISWIYGIPGEGDSIAEKLFGKESFRRWTWDHPDSFYMQGNHVLRQKTLEKAGGHEEHLSYLLKNYVIADLPWHIMTTFPLVYRGMWVFELWLFIPYITFLFLLWYSYRQKRYDYIFYAMIPWFMLGLHGFVSVNIARYNLPMQGCLGISLAWAITAWWDKRKMKLAAKAQS